MPTIHPVVDEGLGNSAQRLLWLPDERHAHLEGQLTDPNRTVDPNSAPDGRPAAAVERPSTREVLVRTSLREPALSACSQAGLVNNLNDGLAWGLLPLLFVRGGLPVGQVGLLAALCPAVWGLGQLHTGPLSDRLGRKPPIAGGMLLQAVALAGTALAGSFALWAGWWPTSPAWRPPSGSSPPSPPPPAWSWPYACTRPTRP